MSARLPERLYAAFEWTAAAGELRELRDLPDGEQVETYCRESAANAVEHDVYDVSEEDLLLLARWLRASSTEVAS